ncbi:MAG: hypothetical protein A2381_19275 [Bdellovibrionales bacterium RIFOXYB1_FULL_37_110]|nr:MAG: hypothetical protein A2181_00150 [Bdellovibrionales bacterium RIFOXYA1_FULL_38_20]OFZ49520.1 MAG: hypothetical protein A2417_04425 [Bdellovibrionales bacterium RIFOXYC1_FULL_37_79]OFZ58674.1 MAG: hypothetical protein A2381_19275 [Bdellovibrionales bacterium RIFOXYB1_FULL_37_110]OFZ63208.1 MAG: hypothetical protein A2577_16810 [Bdellovibrionales bacterium RIFOXYD1_FULL_36_51]
MTGIPFLTNISPMDQFSKKNMGGAVLLVSCITGLFSFLILQYLTTNATWRKQSIQQWNEIVARESAQSAFVLMEAALERRLWEIPPDKDCKKQLKFSLNGSTDTDASYEVKAQYLPVSKLLVMNSVGSFKDTTVYFEKNLIIGDVTDYLVWSRAQSQTMIDTSPYATHQIAKVVGKHRKIYFEGPVQLAGSTYRAGYPPLESRTFSDFAPMKNPDELKIVMQSERMIFQKGLSYGGMMHPKPDSTDVLGNLNQPNFYNLFTTTAPENSYRQHTSGGTFITNDFSEAQDIINKFDTNTPINMNLLKKHFYPRALFCGTPPLNAETGVDDGCYTDDPDKWLFWDYNYGGLANFGMRADFGCFAPNSTTKRCSDSSSFPKGFTNWRTNSGLQSSLFTTDVEIPDAPTINWDNMEAFKEDASACGLVIDDLSGFDAVNQDCEIDRVSTITKYISGDPNPCTKIHQLNLENLATKLKNFDVNTYLNTPDKELARRVIYASVPLEIVQTDQNGLASDILSTTIREKLALWMVSEDTHYLMPNQPDTTSPIDVDPSRLRELYFNAGPSATQKAPLKLVFLSPERTIIHSPFRKRTTYDELKTYYPITGGRIRPAYSIHTDWVHQEDDGFKYGVRKVIIKNLALLDNGDQFLYNNNLYLTGLWFAAYQNEQQYLRNNCFLSDGSPKDIVDLTVTATQQGIMVPPITSRFYNQSTSPATISNTAAWPRVFEIQNGHGLRLPSIELSGTRVGVKFSDVTPTGKRRLDQPQGIRQRDYYNDKINLADRRVNISPINWYYPVNPDIGCEELFTTNGGASSYYLNYEATKNDSLFVHEAPFDTFLESGGFYAVSLPIVKTRSE